MCASLEQVVFGGWYAAGIGAPNDGWRACGWLWIARGRAADCRMLARLCRTHFWKHHCDSKGHVTGRITGGGQDSVKLQLRTRGGPRLFAHLSCTDACVNKKTAGTHKRVTTVKFTGSCNIWKSPTLLVELLLNCLLCCPGAHRTPQSVWAF